MKISYKIDMGNVTEESNITHVDRIIKFLYITINLKTRVKLFKLKLMNIIVNIKSFLKKF